MTINKNELTARLAMMGLNRKDFARLIGVNAQTIYVAQDNLKRVYVLALEALENRYANNEDLTA